MHSFPFCSHERQLFRILASSHMFSTFFSSAYRCSTVQTGAERRLDTPACEKVRKLSFHCFRRFHASGLASASGLNLFLHVSQRKDTWIMNVDTWMINVDTWMMNVSGLGPRLRLTAFRVLQRSSRHFPPRTSPPPPPPPPAAGDPLTLFSRAPGDHERRSR